MQEHSHRQAGAGRRGFTLIELLVSMAIGTVLILVASMLVAQVIGTWQQVEGEGRNNADAGVALDLIGEDLRSLVRRGDGAEWMRSLPLSSGDPASVCPSAPWLMFLSSPGEPDRPVEGDVCAVSYRLALQDPVAPSGGGYPMFALYRDVLDPATTFAQLGSGDLFTDLWTPNATRATSLDSYIAGHIVSFGISFWFEDGNGDTLRVDAADTDLRMGAVATATPASGAAPPDLSSSVLQAIEITLVALDPDQGALAAEGAFTLPDAISRFGHRYSVRIDVPAPAL